METHYDGHVIKVTASPIPETATWTFSALVTWTQGTQQRVKLFVQQQCHFATETDALRHGLEVATNWIMDGKPEQSSEDHGHAGG